MARCNAFNNRSEVFFLKLIKFYENEPGVQY